MPIRHSSDDKHNKRDRFYNGMTAAIAGATLIGASYSTPDYKLINDIQKAEKTALAEANLSYSTFLNKELESMKNSSYEEKIVKTTENYVIEEMKSHSSSLNQIAGTITEKKTGKEYQITKNYNENNELIDAILIDKKSDKKYHIIGRNDEIYAEDGLPVKDKDRKTLIILYGLMGIGFLRWGKDLFNDEKKPFTGRGEDFRKMRE